MLPYLILKREEALLGLKFLDTFETNHNGVPLGRGKKEGLPMNIYLEREKLFQKMKTLKKERDVYYKNFFNEIKNSDLGSDKPLFQRIRDLKSKGKKPDHAQMLFLDNMSKKNYYADWADSFECATTKIENYMVGADDHKN